MASLKKKILITGGGGFLGSNLVQELVHSYVVVVLEKGTCEPVRLKNLLSEIRIYDIDEISLENLFKKEEIDYVIHCATSYGHNEVLSSLIKTNVIFPLQLIEKGVEVGKIKAFFNTDSFFNKPQNQNYSYLGGYILTKNMLEKSLRTLKYKLKVFNLKLEHLYGMNDNKDKFVTTIIHQLLSNVAELDLTKGDQKRDYIFVKDVVGFYKFLLDCIDQFDNKYYNYEIGAGNTTTLREFVELIKKITTSKTKLNFGAINYRENEIMESVANTKPLNQLGWEARYSVEEGLKMTIENEKLVYNERKG